jgi:hypothetical protein
VSDLAEREEDRTTGDDVRLAWDVLRREAGA